VTRTVTRGLFLIWIGVIVLVVVPWGRFQDHPHWGRVDWLPFISQPIRVRDVVANTLLYLPFGYWHRKQSLSAPVWRTVALAFGLSIAMEFTQIFSHGRFPSMRDVTCNTVGAMWGAMSARR
jgi:glycopeptide antibiotics resistance protein